MNTSGQQHPIHLQSSNCVLSGRLLPFSCYWKARCIRDNRYNSRKHRLHWSGLRFYWKKGHCLTVAGKSNQPTIKHTNFEKIKYLYLTNFVCRARFKTKSKTKKQKRNETNKIVKKKGKILQSKIFHNVTYTTYLLTYFLTYGAEPFLRSR
jgi:hypothetical protein